LWTSTERGIVTPFLKISSFEKLLNQSNKPVIMKVFLQDSDEYLVVQMVKRSYNWLPRSRTQKAESQKKLKSSTRPIPCLDDASA
jgi:hypothetical protein